MQKKDLNRRGFYQSAAVRMCMRMTRNSTHFSGTWFRESSMNMSVPSAPRGQRNKWRVRQQETILPWNYLRGTREHVSITHISVAKETCRRLVGAMAKETRKDDPSPFCGNSGNQLASLTKRCRSSREISINNSCNENATHSPSFKKKEGMIFQVAANIASNKRDVERAD